MTDLVEALPDIGEQTAVVVLDAELIGAQGLGLGDVEGRRLCQGFGFLVGVLLLGGLLLLLLLRDV